MPTAGGSLRLTNHSSRQRLRIRKVCVSFIGELLGKGPRQRSVLNRHRSEGRSPERPVCKRIFPNSMTPAEGSDPDKVVRPLNRGRKGVLHIVIHRSSALRALTCAYLTRTPQPGSSPLYTPINTLRQDVPNENVARSAILAHLIQMC